MLFELLTLTRPFDAPSLGELALMISTAAYDDAVLAAAPYSDTLRHLASDAALLAEIAEAEAIDLQLYRRQLKVRVKVRVRVRVRARARARARARVRP